MNADVLIRLRARPEIAGVLDALGRREDVWVVGGAVRDALLQRAPRDLDLVVEGDAAELAAELGDLTATHEAFGTAEARVGALDVGVAMARSERYPAPGALPEVRPATLAEDLTRRDFTVNAVAVGLDGAVHGAGTWQEDLAAGRLRVLHDGAFLDDPTRLWRAARYAARLGFGLDEGTEALARAAVAAGALGTAAGPRLGAELLLALDEPDPPAALAAAHALGLLPAGAHPRRGLVREALALAAPDGHPGLVTIAAMCGAVPGDRLRGWLDGLGIPAHPRDVVLAAATGAEPLAGLLAGASSPSEVAAAARGRPVEQVALAGAIGAAAPAEAWLRSLRHVRLAITGADLLAAGVPEGPDLGRRLGRALAAQLDGAAPDRERQLVVALSEDGETR